MTPKQILGLIELLDQMKAYSRCPDCKKNYTSLQDQTVIKSLGYCLECSYRKDDHVSL